jgi:hypothetical protein
LTDGTPNAGSGNGKTWSNFRTINDAGGTVNFNASGSVTGSVTAATLDYSGYVGPVTFDVADRSGNTTGIGTTWTGVSAVTGNGDASSSIIGNGATYLLANATPDAGSRGTIDWTAFPNITDATGAVNFNATGSVSGVITADTLNYGSYSSAVAVDLQNATATGTGGISGINHFVGSGNSDTLTGADVANTWTINSANAGNVNGTTFSSFENLVGGSANDAFIFSNNATIGTISGGTGTDTLNLSAYTTSTNVTLTGSSVDGYAGNTASVTGGFDTIDVLRGSATASNTLTGMNAASTWTGTGVNQGTYTSGVANSLSFSNFRNWVAGTGADTFTGVNITGLLSDAAGGTTVSGTIQTGGSQNFGSAVTLVGATTFKSTGANVSFGSTVTGPFNLTVSAATSITPGTIDVASAKVTLTGGSIQAGSITGGSATFSSGADVTNLTLDFQNKPILLSGAASNWTLFGTTPQPSFSVTNSATNVFYNGAAISGNVVNATQQSAGAIGSTVNQIATQALQDALDTDSVQKQIDYGFAGDVGTTPPMDHRIDETGISTPECFDQSREGEPCR